MRLYKFEKQNKTKQKNKQKTKQNKTKTKPYKKYFPNRHHITRGLVGKNPNSSGERE